MKRIGNFFKENIKYILILIVVGVIVNYPLPYYVSAPGGTIDITDRIEISGGYTSTGSLNLLYVSCNTSLNIVKTSSSISGE